jgi:hypothetical protein
MSYDNFKPELVLAELVLGGKNSIPGMQFVNLDIGVGLKEKGTKVKINTLGDPTVNDTSESVAMTYEQLDTTLTNLTITADKTVSVRLNDNDMKQIEASGQSLEQAIAGRMMYKLADVLDAFIHGKYTEATVENYETGTTAWKWGTAPTAAEIAKFFASVNKSMDDANCETMGRFCSLPNIAIQGIRVGMGQVETGMGDAARATGAVWEQMQGLKVFRASNAVSTGGVTHGIAGNLPSVGEGVPGCIAAAIQISPEIEVLRLEGFWARGVRARLTYGAVVFKPDRTVDINLDDDLLT